MPQQLREAIDYTSRMEQKRLEEYLYASRRTRMGLRWDGWSLKGEKSMIDLNLLKEEED